MAKQVQLRRGTTSEHSTFTGAVGEVTVDTTKDTLVVHDGSTTGGIPLARQSSVDLKAPIASPVFTGDLRADRLIAYGSGGRTSNVAVGAGSLNSNISEVQITAVGENALYNNTGGYNTAIGKDALYNNTTGIVNTGIGLYALKYKQDGSINTNFNYCTGLGFETRVGGNNATAIGCYASAPASCVALGTSNERTLVGGAVDNGTDRLQVNGSIKSTYAPISDLNVTYDGIDLSTFAKAGAYVAIVASNYPSGNADEYYYIEQICHNESWILQRATRMTDFKGSGVAGLGVTNQRIKIGVTWQGWKQVTN